MENPQQPPEQQQQTGSISNEALSRFFTEYGDLRLTMLQASVNQTVLQQQLDAAHAELAALKAKYEPAEPEPAN